MIPERFEGRPSLRIKEQAGLDEVSHLRFATVRRESAAVFFFLAEGQVYNRLPTQRLEGSEHGIDKTLCRICRSPW